MQTFRALTRVFPSVALASSGVCRFALYAVPRPRRTAPPMPLSPPQRSTKRSPFLASDALRGTRAAASPGNEKGGAVYRRRIRPLRPETARHLQRARPPAPPIDGSGYYQPFRFRAGHDVGKHSSLTLSIPTSAPTPSLLKYPEGTVEPSSVSAGGNAEGLVVFVGYGIRAPQANHDDFSGVDVKGKIVLMLAGSPANDPKSPLAELADIRPQKR